MMGLKYYAEIPRLEVAHEALGDRCIDTMYRLPTMLLRDYKNVRGQFTLESHVHLNLFVCAVVCHLTFKLRCES